MFDILRPLSVTKWTKGNVNYRRKRTDVISVESLNSSNKFSISNKIMKKGKNNDDKRDDKRSFTGGTPININVKVLRDECDCALKKRKNFIEEEVETTICICATDAEAHSPKPYPTVQEEMIGKKQMTTVEATIGGAKSTRRDSAFTKMITYNVRGRCINDPAGFDWTKSYWYGEKGSGFRTKSGGAQDFYALRDKHLQSGTLFEDPEFPANDYSLFANGYADRSFVWKRPKDIVRDPQLFVEGFSRFDVQQGELGDCWLLAATANLTMYRRLFFQIVPEDQGFDKDYAGIFHFRFWQYGRWVDIVIDDRLPTDNGKLVYLHSTEDNEFWSALLEKAYAKLHGSYEALKGGSTCEAMEDFTGGVTEMYELENTPPNLFKILEKAFERASLMGCSLEPDPNVLEAQTDDGLIRGHAYSVTKVIYVNITTPNVSGKIPLLRLRNPWGNEAEWNGAWSDGAPEWRYISDSDKKNLGLVFDNDGEFWMSFQDWEKHFDRLEICNLNPDSLTDSESQNKKKWEMSIFEGAWVKGVTAGGCRNFLDTFWSNPQYRITLTDIDEDDDDNKCTCIVALMQKNRRQIKTSSGEELLTMGFAVYYLSDPNRVPKPLDLNFFKYNASVARSPSFINLREVTCRFKLPPGTYCIVPSTYDPNEEGEFLLRVFSEHSNNMQEHDNVIGFKSIDERIKGPQKVKDLQAAPPRKSLSKSKILAHKESESDLKRKEASIVDFTALAGEDGEVDYLELKKLLDNSFKQDLSGEGFSKEISRCMVAMLDSDYSGKLGRDEFNELWDLISTWTKAFKLFDVDNSGTLSGFELRNSLSAAGYTLTNHVLNILMHRYGDENREISIDEFMLCAIRLKTMIDKFEERQQGDVLKLSKEEWIESTLYS